MKKLSFWAKGHRRSARVLLVVLHLLLCTFAAVMGSALRSLHYTPGWSIATVFFLLLLTAIYYRGHEAFWAASRYFRQKTCDFLVAMSCCCLLCFMVSKGYTSILLPPAVYGSLPENDKVEVVQPVTDDAGQAEIKPPRHRRHLLLKVLLILCVGVFAAAVFYGIAGLACGLSCSGSTGLAIVVLVAGLTGIIVLSLLSIKAILRWGRRNRRSIHGDLVPGTISLR